MAGSPSLAPVLGPEYTHAYEPCAVQGVSGHARLVLRAIITAIKPRTRPGVEADKVFDPPIEEEILHFVDHFMQHMPRILRGGLSVALLLLEGLAVLFTRRRLTQLDRDAALGLCERWQNTWIMPLRELMKAMRALSMAGIYSHPLVMEHIGYLPQDYVRQRIAWRQATLPQRSTAIAENRKPEVEHAAS